MDEFLKRYFNRHKNPLDLDLHYQYLQNHGEMEDTIAKILGNL